MKKIVFILFLWLNCSVVLNSQETYFRLGSGDSIDNHDRNHCNCFDYYYISLNVDSNSYQFEKNLFLENDVSQIYQDFNLRYFNDKSVKLLLDSLSSKFLILKVEFNRRNPHFKTYLIERISAYYYYDSTTYLRLTLCLNDNTQFENCSEKENWKKIYSLTDYCAYINKVNISKSINSLNNLYSQIRVKNKKLKNKSFEKILIEEEKKLKIKIDEITDKIRRGEIVLPSGNGKNKK